MNLSPNFTLEQLTFSQVATRRGIDNMPVGQDRDNLVRLCDSLLEPLLILLGVPLHIDSGYRSPMVNIAIGGALKSAHVEGRAADIVPIGMDLEDAFDAIRKAALPIDVAIFECRAWIHVAIAPVGSAARHQALLAAGGPGHWSYSLAP